MHQTIFEARYEKGYRYFDRCGDTMIILDKLLPDLTNQIWMTDEPSPSGARLKCPDLDIIIVFDTVHLVIERKGDHSVACDFEAVASLVYSLLVGRLDLTEITRFGARRVRHVNTESVDQAHAQSLMITTHKSQESNNLSGGLRVAMLEQNVVYESEDGSRGMRILTRPFMRFERDTELDPRLKLPPRMQSTGQREALIRQLHRQRKQDSAYGLMVDVDSYLLHPPKNLFVPEFLKEAWIEADKIERMHLPQRLLHQV